jgi:ribonucleoside-triphosphate reductase
MAIPTRVGFQCVSEDTEILTPEGWKRHDEIKVGDEIKTLNLETKKIENKKVKFVFKRDYRGIMYHLKGKKLDQLISPEHRVVRKTQNNSYQIQPIEEILKLNPSVSIPIIQGNKIEEESIPIKKIKKINYEGIIWCPHTENGTIIARRKGKVFITGNCPFTNITLDLKPSPVFAKMPVIIGGKPQDKTYGEFEEEMKIFDKALYEVYMEGDAKGRPFHFPIPTINITKDFPWQESAFDGIFEASAKYGTNYFANYINSEMKPEDVRSMCCRLRLNLTELYNRGGGGLFGSGSKTGSIGVVTIGLPRIGYLSKTKKEFFERLARIMDLAKESLEIKRKVLENYIEKGLYPYSRYYLQDIKQMRGKYWANHFSTIGLVGMNECLLNFMGENIATKRGRKFALEVLDFMRERLVKYQEETGNIYNLEATPAESTAYRLALKDKERYPDIITSGTKKVPYYTNSTQLPVNYTDDVFEALKLQDEIQCKYTGGTVLHIFLGERMQSGEGVKRLVNKVFENFKLPYITITPTFSICPVHGYIPGEHFFCPKCTIKQPCEVYTRIVGYYRPVQQFNLGKQQEFKQRKEFKIKETILK